MNKTITPDTKQSRSLMIAIIFSAVIMRAPITAVGPLVGFIKESLDLSNTMAGLITTIPLAAFAVVSPFVSRFDSKFGTGKVMLFSVFTIAIGILVRSYIGIVGFFLGTVIIGIGIAIINVMLPSVSRTYYPLKFGLITSIYITVMSVFSGVSTGISVPLALNAGLGWQTALAFWLIFAIAAIAIWFSFQKLHTGQNTYNQQLEQQDEKKIYKSSTAWWLSIYTGIQSLMFYCFIAWLPTMLQAKGLTTENAGYLASIYQMFGILASFTMPLIAEKVKNQQILVCTLSTFYLLGVIVFLYADGGALLISAMLVCSFCGSAGVSLSMLFIGLRSTSPRDAAKLSGMSQSFGYALATLGPFMMGRLSDITGSWNAPIICLIAVAVIMIFVGFKAGKNRTV